MLRRLFCIATLTVFAFGADKPGLDGFELCKRLRALPGYKLTPVIYVTGHDDFGNRAKSTLSGGNDLIAKPFLPETVQATVGQALFFHPIKRKAA